MTEDYINAIFRSHFSLLHFEKEFQIYTSQEGKLKRFQIIFFIKFNTKTNISRYFRHLE